MTLCPGSVKHIPDSLKARLLLMTQRGQTGKRKAIHHRGTEDTEVSIVNRAAGAFNNLKNVFSVSSVPLW